MFPQPGFSLFAFALGCPRAMLRFDTARCFVLVERAAAPLDQEDHEMQRATIFPLDPLL